MNLTNQNYLIKLLHKFYLRLKERFDPTPPLREEEVFAMEICKKLISKETSKLTIAPLSNKRYIKNDENDMFIVIHNVSISLINHVYSYNIYIENTKNYDEIVTMFDNELEERRVELEEEIRSNIKHSMKAILDKIN
jgi:hypothetical protein